jgi:hypothetical protein
MDAIGNYVTRYARGREEELSLDDYLAECKHNPFPFLLEQIPEDWINLRGVGHLHIGKKTAQWQQRIGQQVVAAGTVVGEVVAAKFIEAFDGPRGQNAPQVAGGDA